MSAVLKIRSFKGIAEPGEDPEEYLDDVQMAAEVWEVGKEDAAALEKSLLRFFRQNL
jgi:predicted RNase H-like HicB family nuclease